MVEKLYKNAGSKWKIVIDEKLSKKMTAAFEVNKLY